MLTPTTAQDGPKTLTEIITPVFFPTVNEVAFTLASESTLFAQTPIQAHYTFIISTAARESYAACDPTALSFFGVKDQPSATLCTRENRAIMRILTTLYVIKLMFPGDHVPLEAFLGKVGVEMFITSDLDTPQGFAYMIAKRIENHFSKDGWNVYGDAMGKKIFPIPYEDTTNYYPKNPAHLKPEKLRYPLKWQPLTQLLPDKVADRIQQVHITPHIGRTVKPVSMSMKKWNQIRTKSPYNYPKAHKKLGKLDELKLKNDYIPNMLKEMRKTSKNRNNERFRIAWWDNKFFSASRFGAYYEYILKKPLETAVFSSFGQNMALHDAILLSWREKRRHDLIRPGPIIKRLFKGKKINSYRGVNKTSGFIDADEWQSVIPTMPHSEFPSGSAVLCHAILGFVQKQLLYSLKTTNSSVLPPYVITFPPNTFSYQGNDPVSIMYKNLLEAADDCAQSRILGGLHFKPSVDTGIRLGKIIAESAFQTWKELQEGRVPQHCHWCLK